MNQCGVRSDADYASVCHDEEGVKLKGNALDLPVDLHFCFHPWSHAVGKKNEIMDTSTRNEFPLQGRFLY